MLRVGRVLWVLIFAITSMLAQSNESGLKSRLQGKQLYLRGCWGGIDLSFDSAGNVVSSASKTSFTLCGFELKSLKLTKEGLTLKGKRLGLEFKDGRQLTVPIKIEDPKILIAAPANGDYGPALDKIFASDVSSIVAGSPHYWDTWGQRSFPIAYINYAGPARADNDGDDEKWTGSGQAAAKKVGGSVSAPRVLHMEDARFSNAARRLHYSGTMTVMLVVGVDGRPHRIRITKPVGLGLDEAAVAAAEQYTFAPATQDGKPVPVEVAIEVAFHVY